MNRRTRALIVCGAVLACLGASAPPGVAATDDGPSRGHCARTFDAAQRADMESFRDFDAATFRSVHAEDTISIFPTGEMHSGIGAVMAAFESHFTNRWAVWSWTEVARRVDGCRSAVIVYETRYDIPRYDYYSRARASVTYVHRHGRWLVVMDQATPLEPSGD